MEREKEEGKMDGCQDERAELKKCEKDREVANRGMKRDSWIRAGQ